MTELVTLERRGNLAIASLNRPDVLNALSPAVLGAIEARVAEVAADSSLRALVVTGEGRAFAAGADIGEFNKFDTQAALEFSRLGHRAFGALEALTIPTIAAVNGVALGGGCELALACDWIYASRKARFGQPEVKLGLIPGFGGTSRLVRRVGVAWAKELVLGGDPIDADTALRIGLANRVYEPEELMEKAIGSAESVAARGPIAVSEAKRLLEEGQDADVRVAHAMEQAAFATVFSSADREEGVRAFLEKRDAKFEGR